VSLPHGAHLGGHDGQAGVFFSLWCRNACCLTTCSGITPLEMPLRKETSVPPYYAASLSGCTMPAWQKEPEACLLVSLLLSYFGTGGGAWVHCTGNCHLGTFNHPSLLNTLHSLLPTLKKAGFAGRVGGGRHVTLAGLSWNPSWISLGHRSR